MDSRGETSPPAPSASPDDPLLVPYQAMFARSGRQPVARDHRRLGYLRGLQPGVPASGIMSWRRVAASGTLGLNERHPTNDLRRPPRRRSQTGPRRSLTESCCWSRGWRRCGPEPAAGSASPPAIPASRPTLRAPSRRQAERVGDRWDGEALAGGRPFQRALLMRR
jgi:hypothetical protein